MTIEMDGTAVKIEAQSTMLDTQSFKAVLPDGAIASFQTSTRPKDRNTLFTFGIFSKNTVRSPQKDATLLKAAARFALAQNSDVDKLLAVYEDRSMVDAFIAMAGAENVAVAIKNGEWYGADTDIPLSEVYNELPEDAPLWEIVATIPNELQPAN